MELQIDLSKRYTYADYLTWTDDVRRELIDGFIKILPFATPRHGKTCVNIATYLNMYTKQNNCTCEVFTAPVDVVLVNSDENDVTLSSNVVQPDVFVVCDKSKINPDGAVVGAPDLIVEVVSKSNTKRDVVEKFRLYEKFLVPEYWIVYPKTKLVVVHKLKDGEYDQGAQYSSDEEISIDVFNGYSLPVNDFLDY
jgi:Uma2 family endonuclease